MGKLSTMFAGALLVAVAAPAAAERPSPEAQLERALAGRVAGDPVDCIDTYRVRSSRIIDGTAILYEAGSVIYVNRPRSGAETMNHWDTLVTRLHSTRLCSIDTVRLLDSSTRFERGVVFLGDFVPYRRVEAAHAD